MNSVLTHLQREGRHVDLPCWLGRNSMKKTMGEVQVKLEERQKVKPRRRPLPRSIPVWTHSFTTTMSARAWVHLCHHGLNVLVTSDARLWLVTANTGASLP